MGNRSEVVQTEEDRMQRMLHERPVPVCKRRNGQQTHSGYT
jgi:hypothetical protein